MIKNITKDFTSALLNYVKNTNTIYLDFDNTKDDIGVDCCLVIHNLNGKNNYFLKSKAEFSYNKMKCVVSVDNQELSNNNLLISDHYYNYLPGNYVSIFGNKAYIPRAFITSLRFSEDFNLILEVSSDQMIRRDRSISNNINCSNRKYHAIMFQASWKIGLYEYEEATEEYFLKIVKVKSSKDKDIVKNFCFILFYKTTELEKCLNKIYEINNYFSFIYRCISKIAEIYVLADDSNSFDEISFEKIYNSDTVEYQDKSFNSFVIPPLQILPVFEKSNNKQLLFYSWEHFFRTYKNHLWFVDSFSSTLGQYRNEIFYPQNNFILSLFYMESIWRAFFNKHNDIKQTKEYSIKKKRMYFSRLLKEVCSVCITEQLQCYFSDVIPENSGLISKDCPNKLQDKIAIYLYKSHKQFKALSSESNRKVSYKDYLYENHIAQYNLSICAFNLLLISLLYAYFDGNIRYVELWIMQRQNFLVKPIKKRFYNLGL